MKPNAPSSVFWHNGLHFACTLCGHCCRHEPGFVFLSKADLKALALHMNLSENEFSKKYCRIVVCGDENRLSLSETEENDCILWDKVCTVYKSRPLQCRTYPFWSAILASQVEWEKCARECPGVNRGRKYPSFYIRAQLKMRERDNLISPMR